MPTEAASRSELLKSCVDTLPDGKRDYMTIQPAAPAVAASTHLPSPAVEAEGLVKTYPKGVQALKGVSFSVGTGAIFALLGPNGAGKSTIVKILTTLSRPTAGHPSVVGRDVVREPERVHREIGVVAQKSAVDLEATAAENLRLQGQLYGLSSRELRRRVSSLLARLDLPDARKRIARTLSGGMQRKLDVAMSLIHQPQVLFLDEPTTGLDPEARADMWREIARLTHEDGLTVVLTTHYLEEADHLAQRVAIIDHGQIVVEGTPEGLKAELRGDAIQVELADAISESQVRAALSGLGGLLREVAIDGRVARARVDSGASALPTVLAALDAAGIRAAAATVARPSLDDVYPRYTGRAYSQVENKETIR
jgi:ABC-2 type transport system ATP-binding protein